jgi:hypothetical protein
MKREEIEANVGAMRAVLALLVGDFAARSTDDETVIAAQSLALVSADKPAAMRAELKDWIELLMQAHPSRASGTPPRSV